MNFRKIGLISALCLFALLAVVFLINYLTTGEIVISTNDPSASIRITKLPDSASIESSSARVISKSMGSSTVRLGAGNYIVEATHDKSGSSQVVSVSTGQSSEAKLNLSDPLAIEPVADNNATGIIANQSQLNYLDPNSKHLFTIGSDNKVHPISTAVQFQSVQWSNTSYGVAQSIDGVLYEISNGSISPLTLSTSAGVTSYSLSPGRLLYVNEGNKVFTYQSGKLHQIFTASGQPTLKAGNKGVAVVSKQGNGNSKTIQSEITLITLDGKTVSKPIGLYELAWSPDSKYLAISDDTQSLVLDSDLNQVAIIPASNISNPTWVNNAEFYYSLSSQLWLYNLNSHTSNRIATVSDGGSILGISEDDQKNYIYLAAEHGYNQPVIKRVSLTGKKISPEIEKAESVTPIITNDYIVSLINFTLPTLFIQPTPYSDLGSYISKAKSDLSSRGIQLSGFNLVTGVSN